MLVMISMPKDFVEMVDRYCEDYKMGRSELIRDALRSRIMEYKKPREKQLIPKSKVIEISSAPKTVEPMTTEVKVIEEKDIKKMKEIKNEFSMCPKHGGFYKTCQCPIN